MIVTIEDGSQQTLLVGSKVTFDPSVLTPNGPFNVLTIDIQAVQFTCDGVGLEGTVLTPNSLIDVDNSAIHENVLDFGNGTQALLFDDAFQLVTALQASEAALAAQVQVLESGAAVAPLNAQIQALTAQLNLLQNKLTNVLGLFPLGVGDKLNQVQSILIAQ